MEFIYNKKNIMDDTRYRFLTNFEYSLLPTEVQMALAESLYGYSVKRAKEKNLEGDGGHSIRGCVHPRYKAYFEANGCSYKNYDFGMETTSITCYNLKKSYKVSEEDKEKLEYYYAIINQAKTDVFDSYCKRFYQAKIDAIETGNDLEFKELNASYVLENLISTEVLKTDLDLTEEEKKHIMEAELAFVIFDIEQGKTPDIVEKLPEAYKNLLHEIEEAMQLVKDDPQKLELK